MPVSQIDEKQPVSTTWLNTIAQAVNDLERNNSIRIDLNREGSSFSTTVSNRMAVQAFSVVATANTSLRWQSGFYQAFPVPFVGASPIIAMTSRDSDSFVIVNHYNITAFGFNYGLARWMPEGQPENLRQSNRFDVIAVGPVAV